MEFDIDIHTGLNGSITIEDYSRDYSQYFPENQIKQEYGRYKYSECKTLNVVVKIETDKVTLTDIVLHNHDQLEEDPTTPGNYIYGLEKSSFTVKKDGYYVVNHLVIPTTKWLENTYLQQDDEYRAAFGTVYIINDDNVIYKYTDEGFVECTVRELIERNPINTTIEKCVIDVFYTGFLQMCYINYCKKLFTKLTKHCNSNCEPEDVKDVTYIRDFLWMTLNIIDYQIKFKQFMEAQRVLEMTNHCGSFCQNQELNAGPSTGCGCS